MVTSSSTTLSRPVQGDSAPGGGIHVVVGGASDTPCAAHLLENGICLPAVWPPAANFSAELKTPPYLVHPPAVINISRGRQFFVDTFLIEETNAATSFYEGEYAPENPVLSPDQEWEKGGGGGGIAMPFSGGSWYYNDSFHLWYNCGPGRTTNISNTCYATSIDGKTWKKPRFNEGTNAVRGSAYHDGNTVWLDRQETNPARRFKIAEVRKEQQDQHYTLLQSADGLNWDIIKNRTGPIQDRSTFFFDPFRDRWVYTNKVSGSATSSDGEALEFGRSHAYFASETSQLCDWMQDGTCSDDSASWTKLFSSDSPSEPRPWVLADVDDPVLKMPNGTSFEFNKGSGTVNPNQLYNLDAIAHESLLVGQFSVLQCKHSNYPAGCPGPEGAHEFNSVFLGWSRDGFHWFRPPAPRKAFAPLNLTGCDETGHPVAAGAMPYAFENCTVWNYEDVQSAAGGWIVGTDDKLYTYVSGRALNMALDQTGLVTLRRDGFASLDSATSSDQSEATFVLTRALNWQPAHRYLFVNFKGRGLRVSIHNATTNATLPHFSADACTLITADSTRQNVIWPKAPVGAFKALQGQAVRFRFEWQSGSLFSFWVAESECGASNGHLPGGGVGIDDSGFDTKGSCA